MKIGHYYNLQQDGPKSSGLLHYEFARRVFLLTPRRKVSVQEYTRHTQ